MPDPDEFVVAIDFGGTKIAACTASLDGAVIDSARIDTDAARGAAQAVGRAVEMAADLSARGVARGGRCVGVGAVSPGIVLADSVMLAPNVPGWDELALPSLLRQGLETDVVGVGNDVNAAALAESRWGALAGYDPGLFISLGTGVKAGIVIGGRVFEGAHGAAGEIGYSLREPTDVATFADGHAPLEEFVGGRAIGERAGRLLGANMTAAEAFERDDLPAQFFAETVAELTMHVANVAIALDPARVVLGGGLMGHPDRIVPALRERLQTAVPFPPEVVLAQFVHDGALRGAVALALDTALQPDPDSSGALS